VRFCFAVLLSEMLPLKTEDHLASPLGPGQSCARRHQISIKIQIELEYY
jgi:hypothetical protein